jgi:hypothetical protein
MTFDRRLLATSLLPLLVATLACRERLPVVESPPSPGGPATTAPGGSATEPPGAPATEPPMVSSRGDRVPQPGSGGAGRELRWDLPDGWRAEPPASAMRMAQAAIPGPGGEGQLVVFFFGSGQGGGTEDNIQRWIEQVNVPPGQAPQRQKMEVGGLAITWVEAHGELQPSTTGMGPAAPQAAHSLFGAVIEGPGGPWFFKATGPTETMKGAREGFLDLLNSLRLRG